MLVRVTCSDCTAAVRVDTDRAIQSLIARGGFGFGKHVSDGRAFAIRLMSRAGWRGLRRLGKSVVTMRCPAHREPSDAMDAD